MKIIVSIMLVGLLWMIYDLINAPEMEDDEFESGSKEEPVSGTGRSEDEQGPEEPAVQEPGEKKR